jgi:hypothetical protein
MLTRRDFTSEFAYQFYLDTVADLKANRRLVSHLDESVRFLADTVRTVCNNTTNDPQENIRRIYRPDQIGWHILND